MVTHEIFQKSKKKKVKSQKIHAKRRFAERYGGTITNQQLEELSADVRRGYCEFVCSISNRLSMFRSGEWVFAYDKQRKTIATFLSRDMIGHYLGQEERNKIRSQEIVSKEKEKIEKLNSELMSSWEPKL